MHRRRSLDRLCHAVTITACLLLVASVPISAQSPAEDPPLRIWFHTGPAFGGSRGIDSGIGGTFQLTGQWGRHHASLRLAGLADFAGFPDSGSDDSVSEFGITYGRVSRTSFGYAAWAGGLSMVRTRGAGASPYDESLTVGLPLTGEVAVQTTFVGLGLQAFANLNPEAPYAGLGLMILLGWMP